VRPCVSQFGWFIQNIHGQLCPLVVAYSWKVSLGCA
jgi:hypothetical protein